MEPAPKTKVRVAFSALLVCVAAGLLYLATSFYLYLSPRADTGHTVVIPPHTGARASLGLLHEAGLIPSLPWIALPVLAGHTTGRLKAGEYEFAPGMSPAQILGKIARGEIVVHKVSVPEGWNSFQVRAALNAEPLLTGDPIAAIPEGAVLPDTYLFTRGEARRAVLLRMEQAQAALLGAVWAARAPNLPLATPEQALALASIVERETGVAEERAQVAGVFVNRLKLGMPLQTDPTVAYGIVLAHGGAPMERALTTLDLKTDTAYNSYTRLGLPPTPICNPGRDALLAALHPAETPALYFVATGHGGHHFAATLEEHQRNVALYHKALQAAAPAVAR